MLLSLKEAYIKFVEEHPDSLSKFYDMRPINVTLFDHIPHYVCVCLYHENVRLLLIALIVNTSLQVEFHQFILTCDPDSQICLTSQCEACKDSINNFKPSNGSVALHYLQWPS